jgi:hypothetical protein
MTESELYIYRSYEQDLSDRIRWLKQDCDNLAFSYNNHGKNLSPSLLDNIIGLANQIKQNLEALK